nr:SDR family NAD(P)-dependent oxidoreductase [Rhodococcus sp. (in: high G+C Gram-positive bacteria)]
MEDLSGTVALVTGASSGIGAATAATLAHRGAAVVLVARRQDLLREVAAGIERSGGRALALAADIVDAEQAREAVARTVEHFGRLDTLVDNAGVMLVGPVADAPEDEWQRMIDVNISGTLHITRAALPHLLDAARTGTRGVADIVVISSTAGRVARAGSAVYSLTKFGIGAFAESLRQELAPNRVRVGVVEPGTVDTDLAVHTRPELREQILEQTRSIERLLPADIADAVAYMVTSPRRVAVNEMLVRAGEQSW